MANWCSNVVEFKGEQSQIEELKKLFKAMALKEKKERRGQLPAFITDSDRGYLFDIRWEESVLYYETKWVPNITVMQQIAEHFGMDFGYGYSEPQMMVYGEAVYQNGLLVDTYLDDDDFDQYDFDEDSDTYSFDGETYNSNDEILDILIERKKAIKSLQQ